jgi:uroporphyrinogen decarboxylase
MGEMTSTERIMMAAVGQEPDRVPVCGVFVDYAWGQLFGKDSFLEYGRDPERVAKAMVWSCKEMGCDSTGVMLDISTTWEAIADASGVDFSPLRWENFVGTHPHRLYGGDPFKEIAYGDPVVKTLEDAKRLKPADPYRHGRMPLVLKALELASKELKGEYPIGGICDAPIHVGGTLMGWTQMFMAMEKDVELWKTVEDVIVATSYEFAKAQTKVGAAGFLSHTELPHKVGSEQFLKNPVWVQAEHPPQLFKRIWEELQRDTTLHACSVGPFEPGIEVWKGYLDHTHSFLMPEYGGADALARAKEQLAPAMMIGNVHPVDTLLHGTTSEVEDACVELIKKCGSGGRFQLGPGCMVPLDAPIENMETMINSVKKHGTYPIKL